MEVIIDPKSGMCFGVVYAIRMAEQVLAKEGMLYCLGDIVHNDEEVHRLQAMGLRKITHEKLSTLHNVKVLVRAHGEPPSTYRIAHENNIKLLDASCPVVLKLQDSMRQTQEKKQLPVYIYGKLGHPEVVGLLGQLNQKATVFGSYEELNLGKIPSRIALYSQTTKSIKTFYDIVDRLQQQGISVDIHDTICRQVSNRDKDIRSFARQVDKVVFVAGTYSSNGKVLYQICKSTNFHTYAISSPSQIQPKWFDSSDKVGICGATSTPRWLMEDVQKHILSYEKQRVA